MPSPSLSDIHTTESQQHITTSRGNKLYFAAAATAATATAGLNSKAPLKLSREGNAL